MLRRGTHSGGCPGAVVTTRILPSMTPWGNSPLSRPPPMLAKWMEKAARTPFGYGRSSQFFVRSPPPCGGGVSNWWWDGTPHQTTIESTESKRFGLLRTRANLIEKRANTPFGRGRSSGFFALIGSRRGFSTSSAFRGQFNSPFLLKKAESNPRPSDRYLPLPQLADGLRQSLLEQRVQVLINRLGWVLQRSAMVGSRFANPGGVQIQ